MTTTAAFGTTGNDSYINPFSPTPSNSQAPSISFGAVNTPTTINSTTAQSSTPIPLPPAPTPNNNYASAVTGGNVTIAGNTPAITPVTTPSGATVDPATGAIVSPPATDTASSGGILDYIKSLAGIKPPSASDQYNTDYNASGISGLQSDFNTKNQAYTDAKAKLDTVNASLAGLNAEATGIPIQDQQDATGRGITAAGLAPKTADELRANALKAIPLQAQALSAQAEVAAAQGNAQLSQSILQQAQDHLDKLFQIHQADATNQYNYQTNVIDKAYQYATTAEKDKLDAQKATLTQNLSLYNNTISDLRTAASSATASGQGSIATQLASLVAKLNPNSPTFVSDLKGVQDTFAKLQGQIVPKASSEQITQGAIANVNSQLTTAVGGDGYTDPNLYARLRASSTLSATDFDNRFGYLVNPLSRSKLGLTSSTDKTFGTPTSTEVSAVMSALAKDPTAQSSVDTGKLQSDPTYFYWVKTQLGI